MKKGDLIWITCDGRRVEGWIMLASTNKISLMLGFEAMLSGHVGMMPVLYENGEYRSIVNGAVVTIEERKTS